MFRDIRSRKCSVPDLSPTKMYDNINQKRNYGALKQHPNYEWREGCFEIIMPVKIWRFHIFRWKGILSVATNIWKSNRRKRMCWVFLCENYVYLYENLYGFLFLIIFNVNKWEVSYEKWYLRYFFCRKSYYRGSKFM